MIPILTWAGIVLYVVILAASVTTPLLGSIEQDSRSGRAIQVGLWIALSFVVFELCGLMTVAAAQVMFLSEVSGWDALRVGLLSFVFSAHGIWLLFGLGTLRGDSSVRGPGTLLIGLASFFVSVCFIFTILLALRAGATSADWTSWIALGLGVVGIAPFVVFPIMLANERMQARRGRVGTLGRSGDDT